MTMWNKRSYGERTEHFVEIALTPPRKVCLFVTERAGSRRGSNILGTIYDFGGFVDHGDGDDYILEGTRGTLEEAKLAAVAELRSFCTECLSALNDAEKETAR